MDKSQYQSGRESEAEVVVIRKGQQPVPTMPENLPKQLSPAIRYAIFHAVNDTMITSGEVRDWVMEMKDKNSDSHVVGDETTTYIIEASESQSLLGRLFGLNPDVSLRFTKTSRPHYEID